MFIFRLDLFNNHTVIFHLLQASRDESGDVDASAAVADAESLLEAGEYKLSAIVIDFKSQVMPITIFC
jgi:hypothetical protein